MALAIIGFAHEKVNNAMHYVVEELYIYMYLAKVSISI